MADCTRPIVRRRHKGAPIHVEAPDGGWGIGGRAYLNEELIAAARTELGRT